MPIPLAIMAIGSLAYGVYSQVKAGKAEQQASHIEANTIQLVGDLQKKVSDSQAKVTRYNATVAELQAQDAIARGESDANRVRQKIKDVIGQQRAAMSANNVDVGYGSAVDVQGDAAYLGELDALTIRTNAAREAWGYQVEAGSLEQEARIRELEGQQAVETANAEAAAKRLGGDTSAKLGWINAGNTALSGVSSLLLAKYGSKLTGK